MGKILKSLLIWGLFAAVGAAIALTIAVVVAWRQLPPIDALKDYKPRMAMQIYSADGELIGNSARSAANQSPSTKYPII